MGEPVSEGAVCLDPADEPVEVGVAVVEHRSVQGGRFGICGCGLGYDAVDGLHALDPFGDVGHEDFDLAALVGLRAHRRRAGLLEHRCCGAADAGLHERAKESAFVFERRVDRVGCDVGGAGDCVDRGGGVAALCELIFGCVEDP
jgi:hypothetical protein